MMRIGTCTCERSGSRPSISAVTSLTASAPICLGCCSTVVRPDRAHLQASRPARSH